MGVVRKLIGDGSGSNNLPDFLHRSTIAAKRADRSLAKSLRRDDVHNSHKFAKFMRRLKKEGAVAIIGQDKYHRFGILTPEEDSMTDGDYEAPDFAAVCYVGEVAAVKDYLAGGTSRGGEEETQTGTFQPHTPQMTPPEESPGWKPHTPTEEPPAENMWKPPGAVEEKEDAALSRKPPTGDGEGAGPFEFGGGAREIVRISGKKRKFEDDEHFSSHADAAAAAADRFYSGLTRELDTRADSRLYHMRAFNGWVKAMQIKELDPRTGSKKKEPLRVLDLACGKGGDLSKWAHHKRGVSNYVGIDAAQKSLVDAAHRARRMRNTLKRCTFTYADLGADAPGRLKTGHSKHMQKLWSWSMQAEAPHFSGEPEFKMIRGGGISLEDKFDVVSIQFAIHYFMETKQRARRLFQTVSELLEVGGNFICTTIDARVVVGHLMNLGLDLHFDEQSSEEQEAVVEVGGGACKIQFAPGTVKQIVSATSSPSNEIDEKLFGLKYTFTLVEGSDHAAGVGDAVNLAEWLAPIPALKALGEEAGLELEYSQNFHEFLANRKDSAAHEALYKMNVLNRNGSISDEEFSISRLYVALKFRKVRESTMKFDDTPEEEEEEEADEDEGKELSTIDPAIKAKLFPMALTKAKKAAGVEAWSALSSEEKNRLTEIELRKLAAK
jgi:mRNA (guanine-N7-)-methyltransferase